MKTYLPLLAVLLGLATTGCVDGDRAIAAMEENNETMKKMNANFEERASAIEKPLAEMTATIAKIGKIFDERSETLVKTAESLSAFVDNIQPQDMERFGKSLDVLAGFISQVDVNDIQRYGLALEEVADSMNIMNEKIISRLEDDKIPLTLNALSRQYNAGMMFLAKLASSFGGMKPEERDHFVDIFMESAISTTKLLNPTLEAAEKEAAEIQALAKSIKESGDDSMLKDVAEEFSTHFTTLENEMKLFREEIHTFSKFPDELLKKMEKLRDDTEKKFKNMKLDKLPVFLETLSKNSAKLVQLVPKHKSAVENAVRRIDGINQKWEKELDNLKKSGLMEDYKKLKAEYEKFKAPGGEYDQLKKMGNEAIQEMKNLPHLPKLPKTVPLPFPPYVLPIF